MKYITAEQFLQADRKVIDSIIAWWVPSIGDLTESTVKGEVWCLVDDIQVKRVLDFRKDNMIIPLLTVGQLIEFIEHKCEGYVEYTKGFNMIHFMIYTPQNRESLATEIRIETDDLLQGLWKVIQKI